MDPFDGFRSSEEGSSYLSGLRAKSAGEIKELGLLSAEARNRVRQAKERARSYAESADREAGSARMSGIMSGLTSVMSGAAGAFGGGGGGIGREMSRIGKAGYTLPTSSSSNIGFSLGSSILGN